MGSLNIQAGGKTINIRVIDMRNKQVIALFFLACSHYTGRGVPMCCDIGKNLVDDRICCGCTSYDGRKVLALAWEEEITFMRYPFKSQYSLEQIKKMIESEREILRN